MNLPLNVGYAEHKLGWRTAEVGMRWVGIRNDKQIVRVGVEGNTIIGWTHCDTENQTGIFAFSAVRSERMERSEKFKRAVASSPTKY